MKYSVFYHHICCAAQELCCTVEDMMEKVRQWEIGYVELDRDAVGADEQQALALGRMMARHGLQPSSIYGFYDWGGESPMPDEDDLLLRQARWLGCERVMVIPGFYADLSDAARCEKEKARMIEGTRQLVALAKARGITVTIECFDDARSPIATIRGMAEFLEAVPDLMVTLETGNFRFSGDDILEAQQVFRDRVRHVHLKDRYLPAQVEGEIPAQRLAGDPATAVTGEVMYPCAVGHGHIPMETVLDELVRWRYEGIMTIEHFGAASYAEAIKDSVDWLKGREASV